MNCLNDFELHLWNDGEFPAELHAEASAHLKQCLHCHAQLETLQRENIRLKQRLSEIATPAQLETLLAERLSVTSKTGTESESTIAALCLVILVVGFVSVGFIALTLTNVSLDAVSSILFSRGQLLQPLIDAIFFVVTNQESIVRGLEAIAAFSLALVTARWVSARMKRPRLNSLMV